MSFFFVRYPSGLPPFYPVENFLPYEFVFFSVSPPDSGRIPQEFEHAVTELEIFCKPIVNTRADFIIVSEETHCNTCCRI